MRRFRVAHVITRLCKGGAQENTFHTVRLADRERFEVDLISGHTRGREGSMEDTVREAGIDIARARALVRPVAPVRDLIALAHLIRLFRTRRYDIVHTHTSKAGFLGRVAARRAGVPIIVHTPHGNVFHGYFPRWATRVFVWMERHAAHRTDRVIELTPGGVEEHLAEWIGRREQYVTIFSGIDLAPFDRAVARREETRRALGIAPEDCLVGAVGRLASVKGYEYFIAAAHRIARDLPEARFILAGQGALEAQLRQEAAGLGDRFCFLGFRDDVPDLMAAMDVFVLTSLNEGMGRVLIEAAAAGTPAVATAVGGVRDIILDGWTGILVPPRAPQTVAEAVCTLARDPDRRRAMGETARETVAPNYGLAPMVEQIEALYEELIREKGLDG